MTRPKISILLPVYNAEKYIEDALQSISNQTFEDFEVIICDDCSQDESFKICNQWAKKDHRLHIFYNHTHVGMTKNWNRCLKETRGDFIVKLDADDAMRPKFLEELHRNLIEDETISVAFCRTLTCDQTLEPYDSYLGDRAFILAHLDPLSTHIQPGHDWYEMCFFDIQLWHSNAQMHRRENLFAIGGWDENWECAADTDLILRVLEQDCDISHNPYCGVLYRRHENSISSLFRKNGWLRIEGHLIHLLSLARYYKKKGKVSYPLRRAWWRYWNNWKQLKLELQTNRVLLPEPYWTNLMNISNQLPMPPKAILAENWLHQKAWNLKHAFYKLGRKCK